MNSFTNVTEIRFLFELILKKGKQNQNKTADPGLVLPVTFAREREAYMLREEALMATRERRNFILAANTGSSTGSCDQI